CPWNRSTCCRAAHNGHLEVLEWARLNGCSDMEFDFSLFFTGSAAAGRLDILQWPRAEGCPWDHHTYEEPRRLGHGDVMNWASLNGCPMQVE
ncbi:unnamed protein product, partial [Laminaria digitata]